MNRKGGMSIVALAEEIERRAKAKKDYVVDSKALTMTDDARLRFGDVDVGVKDLAHQQIADALKIPMKYYDKMRAEAPDLLANNVNEWFRKYPARRMVRTLDGEARAMLSDKFRPLENEDLFVAVAPVLKKLNLSVASCQVTDTRLYIKVVDESVVRELKEAGGEFGDGKHVIVRRKASPAVTISNSEVGYGALSVLGGLYDGFCSNLAFFGERSVRKYHVGQRHDLGEDVYAVLSDKARAMTDAALWAQIGDVVKAAFDRARFDELVDKVEGTAREKIEGDPVEVVSLASQKFGMTEDEGKGILRHLIEGHSLTRFGLYNAITRAAQDLDDYDRASDFERFGAKVVELPKAEWAALAKAA